MSTTERASAATETATQTVTGATTGATATELAAGSENEPTVPTDSDGRIVGGTATDTEATSSDGPGFGLMGGIVALLATIVLAASRR